MGPSLSPHDILFRQLALDAAKLWSYLVRYRQGERSVVQELSEVSGGAEIRLAILKGLRKGRDRNGLHLE